MTKKDAGTCQQLLNNDDSLKKQFDDSRIKGDEEEDSGESD